MSQQPDSSPRITRRLETQPVDPAMSQLDGKAGHADRDDLDAPAGLMALAVKLRFEASAASRSGQFYALNALAAQAAALAENLAGWRPPARVITTADELDALPVSAVILAGGQAWQGIRTPVGPLWRLAGGTSDRSSEYVLCVFGRATVLYTPTEIGDSNG